MGCGGSKDSKTARSNSRKYLTTHAANDGFQGIQLYSPPAGPLTAKDYKERLVTSEGTQCVTLPRSGYTIRYAYVSQRGYYPDSPDKQNQDSFCVHTSFNGDPEQHLFGVFDGHGDCGTQSSQFARDKVPLNLLNSAHFTTNPALAFHQAMVATNLQCHRSEFDDSMSGTTAVTVLIRGRSLLVANVGDSRAVLAEKVPGAGQGYIARDLSIDQTPYRKDECDRVRAAGARVLTLDQIEGLKDPTIECWTTEEEDDGDPPRLWFPNGMYPGTAFTRSIGDAAAERIGVFAEPELEFRHLGPNDAFLVIASDGVFEFISSQRVVDMVSKFDDPHEACLSVVAESYRLWLQYETRTDDITMIMLHFVGLEQPPRTSSLGGSLPYTPSPMSSSLTSQELSLNNGIAPSAAAEAAAQQEQQQQQGPAVSNSGMMLPLRGRLVDDIEALDADSAAAAAAAQNSAGALTTISKWFQSHNYQLDQPAAAAAGSASRSSAAAAMAAAAVQQQQQQEPLLDLGQITEEQWAMLEDTVRHNFLFSHLSEAKRLAVYKAMQRVEVQPNEIIIHQGEQGDHFYIVEDGIFDVMVLTDITDADSFAAAAAAVDQQQQMGLAQQQQQQQIVSGSSTPKQQQQQQLSKAGSVLSTTGSLTGRGHLGSVMLDNDLMADMAANAADEAILSATYGDEDSSTAAAAAGGVALTGGSSISSQQEVGFLGGVQTEYGELVHTYVAPPMTGPQSGGPHPSFGELALLYGKPRAATVVSQTHGVLWRLSRADFRAALKAARGDPTRLVLHALRSCELLECLTNGQLVMLADLLQPRIYQDGDNIMEQGVESDEFYLVAQGEVVAVVRPNSAAAAQPIPGSPQPSNQQQQIPPVAANSSSSTAAAGPESLREKSTADRGREVLTMGPGAYFGEKGILGGHSRPATMVARGKVLILSITRRTFESTFGSLSALAADHAAWQTWLSQQNELLSRSIALGRKSNDILQAKFDPQSLQLRGCLWLLNEAQVLASLEDRQAGVALTGRLHSVQAVEDRGLAAAVSRARQVTEQLPPCLFVPHTVSSWFSPRAGAAVVAGEALATTGICTLAALLQGGALDERSASYIAAMAVLGLSHLHRLGIVYRGLSAITLLVTEGGLVQLVDFRFAKKAEGRTYTLCGVPEYLAPEVIGGTGHDESADWWALGVLIYQLITGGTPFAQLGDDELRIYRRICRCSWHWPATPAGHDISADARDLVAQLLQRDPAKRLGMGKGGTAKLRSHPWFRAINWSDLEQGRFMVPLGLRERLFNSAGGGDLGFWAPTPRQPGAQNPAWLEDF